MGSALVLPRRQAALAEPLVEPLPDDFSDWTRHPAGRNYRPDPRLREADRRNVQSRMVETGQKEAAVVREFIQTGAAVLSADCPFRDVVVAWLREQERQRLGALLHAVVSGGQTPGSECK